MKNKKIIQAMDSITPDGERQEHILRQIYDKAGEPAPKTGRANKITKWVLPIAACLVIVVAALFTVPGLINGDLESGVARGGAVGEDNDGEVITVGAEVTAVTDDDKLYGDDESVREVAVIKYWDDMSTPEKYSYIELNGVSYSVNNTDATVDKSDITSEIGGTTAEGYDVYTDKAYTANCKVYALNAISTDCAVAVKFEGDDNCYPFVNFNYSPDTLGDLIDDLNLRENLVFGKIYHDFLKDYKYVSVEYTLQDPSVIWDLLLDRSLKNLGDDYYWVTTMGISIDVKVIGSENISLSVDESGYLHTNILHTGKSFFIGKDKAQAVIDYVTANASERTVISVYDAYDEQYYEEDDEGTYAYVVEYYEADDIAPSSTVAAQTAQKPQ